MDVAEFATLDWLLFAKAHVALIEPAKAHSTELLALNTIYLFHLGVTKSGAFFRSTTKGVLAADKPLEVKTPKNGFLQAETADFCHGLTFQFI